MRSHSFTALLLAAGLSVFTTPVMAQYAGDLFFPVPSVQVPVGQTTQVEIQLFAGQSVFGATQFEFTYDPSKLEVEKVEPGSSKVIQDSFSYKQQPGKVSFVVLNSKSDKAPIGAVGLARLTLKPLASSGAVIDANLNVGRSLKQDESDFDSANGYGLELVVTNGATTTSRYSTNSTRAHVEADNRPALQRRAERLRPNGSRVNMVVIGANGQPGTVTVNTSRQAGGERAGDGSTSR